MFSFENVFERDIDLLVMRSFEAYSDFAELFLSEIGRSGARPISIAHSLTNPELGESDIVIMLKYGSEIFCLFIENKVDADAMPRQYERYIDRAKLGKNAGAYSDYAIFIIAPEDYLKSNKEAAKYPNCISYETMASFFNNKNAIFECQILKQAINKQASKYSLQENSAVTAFWNELYAYFQNFSVKSEMYPVRGPKGSRSLWPQFKIPLRGAALYYKSDKGFVDLEFSGKINERLRIINEVNQYKDQDMHWIDTGSSLSLRKKTAKMDFSKSFCNFANDAQQVMHDVEKLTVLAIILNDNGFVV